MVVGIEAAVDGRPVVVGEDLLPALPATDDQPWSPEAQTWFWRSDGIIMDVWPWFLAYSGLPLGLLWLMVVPVVGMAAGGTMLWRQWAHEAGGARVPAVFRSADLDVQV